MPIYWYRLLDAVLHLKWFSVVFLVMLLWQMGEVVISQFKLAGLLIVRIVFFALVTCKWYFHFVRVDRILDRNLVNIDWRTFYRRNILPFQFVGAPCIYHLPIFFFCRALANVWWVSEFLVLKRVLTFFYLHIIIEVLLLCNDHIRTDQLLWSGWRPFANVVLEWSILL